MDQGPVAIHFSAPVHTASGHISGRSGSVVATSRLWGYTRARKNCRLIGQETNVAMCEHCGADSLDERGYCRACGWQNRPASAGTDVSSPSLGATRAADVPAGAALQSTRGLNPAYDRTAQNPPAPPERGPLSAPVGTASSVRFCGSCGARITGNEAFCGQCGAPIGATSAPDYGMAPSNPASRYRVGSAQGWTPGYGDDPTEAYMPSRAPGYARPPTGMPYSQPGFGMQEPQPASHRGLRIGLGILFLMGSLASAIGAVVEAIKK